MEQLAVQIIALVDAYNLHYPFGTQLHYSLALQPWQSSSVQKGLGINIGKDLWRDGLA